MLSEWNNEMSGNLKCGTGLSQKELSDAVLIMTQTVSKFWPTDNIPSMILNLVEEKKEADNILACRNRLQLEEAKYVDECKHLKESFGGTEEEAEENKAKIKAMLRGVFR